MYPPVFETIKNFAPAVVLLGANPLRVYVAGSAPQDTKRPYLTWQIISGSPENYFGDRPDIDSYLTQLDVYAHTLDLAREITKAVRDAVEGVAYVTVWLGESQEVDTHLWRVSFEVDWFTDRTFN